MSSKMYKDYGIIFQISFKSIIQDMELSYISNMCLKLFSIKTSKKLNISCRCKNNLCVIIKLIGLIVSYDPSFNK